MTYRVILVHCWSGTPQSSWYPWMKKELESRGFEVIVPAMPDTNEPKIAKWVPALSKVIGSLDDNTILIGHSIGCQTIMRYLATQTKHAKGCVFVTPWFTLAEEAISHEEEEATAKPWLETPIDVEAVIAHAGPITALFSDDDPFVPLENKAQFASELGAHTQLLEDRGHCDDESETFELPEALEAVLALAQQE